MSKYDPASLSDEEEGSVASRSTWASTSDATILGFADGYVGRGGAELEDWRVNRLGGQPSFPPMHVKPASDSNVCKLCKNKMPLIMQIYCPLESSANERVMYTFACPRKACRGKDGSVRVWRANVPFPPDEEEEEEEPAPVEENKPIALGSLIFGGPAAAGNANPFASSTAAKPTVEDVTSKLEKSKIDDAVATSSYMWDPQPAFPAQYLTTAYEPPSPIRKNVPLPVQEEEGDEPKHRGGKGAGGRTKKGAGAAGEQWGKEGYEVQKVKGVDEVFLHFQERVSREGKQVVRYDHSATPLPFSEHTAAFSKIFKRANEDAVPQYDPSRLPSCSCGMPRCYEFQLMPHAVTLLNQSATLPNSTAWPKQSSDPGKEKDKSKLLDEDGLDFSTAMAFVCVAECLNEHGEAWKEETVLIEVE